MVDNKWDFKKKVQICVLVVSFLGITGSLLCMGIKYFSDRQKEQQFQKLREMTVTEVTEEVTIQTESTENEQETAKDIFTQLHIEVPDKQLDFAALQQMNPDIYAWIYIPDTNIDYPILQHPTDDTFYLEHNLDMSEGRPASSVPKNQWEIQKMWHVDALTGFYIPCFYAEYYKTISYFTIHGIDNRLFCI